MIWIMYFWMKVDASREEEVVDVVVVVGGSV